MGLQMCKPHWYAMRQAVEDRGMSGLVARSGPEAMDNLTAELQRQPAAFDPLMAMNFNFMSAAVKFGGLAMMVEPPEGQGHVSPQGRRWCPLCEAKARGDVPDMDVAWIGDCADAMLKHAREQGLIAGVQ